MKNYTLEDIRKLKHCYDPADVLPADWQGTIVDGLRLEHIPPKDRLYIAMQLIPDHTARLFAVLCARRMLALVDSPDPRSLAACDVADRYANGNATDEELKAAYVDAYTAYAAHTAAYTAAYAAATYAAHAVAHVAAHTAATYAATDAAACEEQIGHLIEMLEAAK